MMQQLKTKPVVASVQSMRKNTTLPVILKAVLLLAAGLFSANGAYAQNCAAKFRHSVLGSGIFFSDQSTSDDPITGHIWDFGDGIIDSSGTRNPTHNFKSGGWYQVCLIITDGSCTDTYCDSVWMDPARACDASFTSQQTAPTTFTFQSNSAKPNQKYYWDFGDGQFTTSGGTVSHTYRSFGIYQVCLNVSDSSTMCLECSTLVVPDTVDCNAHFTAEVYHRGWVTFAMTSMHNTEPGITVGWDFGDGQTANFPSSNHLYMQEGKYKVCLTATDTAKDCQSTWCDTVEIMFTQHIRGDVEIVTQFTQHKDIPAQVLLYRYDSASTAITAIDTLDVQTEAAPGSPVSSAPFSFDVKAGTYYLKAFIDPSDTFYYDYLPTYHDTALIWTNANTVTITNEDINNQDIIMRRGNNTGGSGFIGGTVVLGPDNQEGGPVSDIEVMLLTGRGKPVTWVKSDANGEFRFTDIAYGSYLVWAEVPGKTTYPLHVRISAPQPSVADARIIVNKETIVAGTTSLKPEAAILTLYPNPAKEELFLNVEGSKLQYQVIDLQGKVQIQSGFVVSSVQRISITALSKGMYLLRITSDEQSWTGTFVKE